MTEGLSWDIAIRKLRDAIEMEEKRYGGDITIWNLIPYAIFHHFPTASCWILFVLSFLSLMAFVCTPIFNITQTKFINEDHITMSALALLMVICGTFILNLYFVYLRRTEIRRKVNVILRDLDELISDGIPALTTPDLYEPASESITLQWTYRDGILVNLPWMILVEDDVILLRPGREIPCRCRMIEEHSKSTTVEFEAGQYYIPKEVPNAIDSVGIQSFSPLRCRVLETPSATYVRSCLLACERPLSVAENEYGRIVHFYIERIAVPIVCFLTLGIGIISYLYFLHNSRRWYDVVILTPASVILPLAMPMLSLYTWIFVLLHTARFLVRFANVLNSTIRVQENAEDGQLFTEASVSPASSHIVEIAPNRFRNAYFHWAHYLRLIRISWKLVKGDPASLPFSANLVQTLGNVTSLSVVDKKGIMSWANPTPEKVFFFSPYSRHKKQFQSTITKRHRQLPSNVTQNVAESDPIDNDQSSKQKNRHLTVDQQTFRSPSMGTGKSMGIHHRRSQLSAATRTHTEVLDLSHDPYRSFVVHFDDPNWRIFSNNLKPFGLNILLNNCNLHSDYVRFVDHIHAVSAVVPRTIAVVNRRCLCYLAKAIGFNQTSCVRQFETQQTLAAYRKIPGELPLPGLTKHKTPLPNLFAVVVKDKMTGHCQLMCQGTADLVSEACDYYWDGNDVKRLERQHRKKIGDFAQRHSMTAYCVAFSYRPLSCDIDGSLSDTYIDWPMITRGPLTESVDSLLAADDFQSTSRTLSLDSLLVDEYFEIRRITTPSDILNHLLKGQVFLGMISLQYQAKPDVVRLVDSLDKACIRFVHYSKENELRSRIFAEKCGLEAGWNCHISLGKESEIISASGSHLGSQQIAKINTHNTPTISTTSRIEMKWSISRKDSRHQSLPQDFKVGIPLVHFKSATATPIIETVPQVICTITDDNIGKSDEKESPNEDDDLLDDSSTKDQQLENIDRCVSVANVSRDSVFDDPTDEQLISALGSKRERTPLMSDTTSRTSVVTNHSSGNQPIVLPPNRARLPKGIENVRPHLEQVDNVPLLVPLFTDCYPTAIVEMMGIMQEYGEVVCILGSSLNFHNAEIFCQANASIGIEPLHPAVCMNKKNRSGSEITIRNGISATDLTTLISTLPCSISIYAGEQINLLDLISVSRHYLLVLRTSWIFYLSSSLSITAVQLLAQLSGLPRPFTVDLLIWLVCVVIPLLSGSLCASSKSENVLKTATPRNANYVSRQAVKKFLLGFTFKFMPSCIFGLLLFKCALVTTCVDASNLDIANCGYFNYSKTVDTDWKLISMTNLTVCRYLFTFIFVFYLCSISSGFVHYRALYKDRLPFSNIIWLIIIVLLLIVQFLYTILCVEHAISKVQVYIDVDFDSSIWKVYVCGFIWPFICVPLNELLKRYELGCYHRDQRRRRLSFGTKLGMNSPF